jgi:hypothetical protein
MKIRTLLVENEALRFVFVFIAGICLASIAFLSGSLPSSTVFNVLAWPVALMLHLFPSPCFDRGLGHQPFCEGTPVQVVAGGVGLFVLVVFYWLIVWAALRLVLRARSV